jgi:hypothetical protein
MDGQIALDRQLSIPDDADALGFEVQGPKFLYIKEIGALQMRIALFIAGMNRGRLDRGFDAGVRKISSSRNKAPETLENCPFTLAIIMCLTLNSATE